MPLTHPTPFTIMGDVVVSEWLAGLRRVLRVSLRLHPIELQQKIRSRQRELGMTPVLQGFTGHMPAAVARKLPDAKLHRIDWIEWQTHLPDPLDPLFPKVARLMIREQTKRFGTDHPYTADLWAWVLSTRGWTTIPWSRT